MIPLASRISELSELVAEVGSLAWRGSRALGELTHLNPMAIP